MYFYVDTMNLKSPKNRGSSAANTDCDQE